MGLIVTLVILALIVFWAVGMYNNLVNSRNRVRNAFSQIDVQLTRRYEKVMPKALPSRARCVSALYAGA